MAEQVCMAWGAVKVRRAPKAQPPKPPTRKCACGKSLRSHNASGYCGKCYMRQYKKVWLQKRRLDPDFYRKRLADEARWRTNRRSSQKKSMQILLCAAKARARKSGIPFALTLSDLGPLPDKCPVLGTELSYANVGMISRNCSASLDRIVPELGYVTGNVRIISFRANKLRNNATPEELAAVAADAARLSGRSALKAVNG